VRRNGLKKKEVEQLPLPLLAAAAAAEPAVNLLLLLLLPLLNAAEPASGAERYAEPPIPHAAM
jgi:hypothetical protein